MLLFIICVLFVASLGKSLGLRDNYAKFLLKLFEFGRKKIEKAEKKGKHKLETEDESEKTTPNGYNVSVISREVTLVPEPQAECKKNKLLPINPSLCIDKKEFHLEDALDFIRTGVEAVIDDEVTKRFAAEGTWNVRTLHRDYSLDVPVQELQHYNLDILGLQETKWTSKELPAWNLLTRTNKNYQFISIRLTLIWGLGFFLRYFILFPTRLFITIFGVGWLLSCTAFVSCFPEGRFKRWLYWYLSLSCFRIFSCACSAIVTYHNRENRAEGGGICVANHTSPIDVVILASDNCYALVGQSHGGFLGVLQRGLARATAHIWFERSEIKDRELVTKRLKEHVENKNKLPILVFPEGTCINNTSVMMFKKGSFEVGGTIYPVAIKYDPKFGDPFWNSSKQSYMHYLLMMMTSWAMVCDVWYLAPMTRKDDESAVEFANRVKAAIAQQGGLVDLMWDGQLKRMKVKQEWIEVQQKEYSRRIKID